MACLTVIRPDLEIEFSIHGRTNLTIALGYASLSIGAVPAAARCGDLHHEALSIATWPGRKILPSMYGSERNSSKKAGMPRRS